MDRNRRQMGAFHAELSSITTTIHPHNKEQLTSNFSRKFSSTGSNLGNYKHLPCVNSLGFYSSASLYLHCKPVPFFALDNRASGKRTRAVWGERASRNSTNGCVMAHSRDARSIMQHKTKKDFFQSTLNMKHRFNISIRGFLGG